MTSPLANHAAGQIAVQVLLSTLMQMFLRSADDPDELRQEVLDAMNKMIDSSAIPNLPAAEQKDARAEAKTIVRHLVVGASPAN
jgi:hypothetical protein